MKGFPWAQWWTDESYPFPALAVLVDAAHTAIVIGSLRTQSWPQSYGGSRPRVLVMTVAGLLVIRLVGLAAADTMAGSPIATFNGIQHYQLWHFCRGTMAKSSLFTRRVSQLLSTIPQNFGDSLILTCHCLHFKTSLLRLCYRLWILSAMYTINYIFYQRLISNLPIVVVKPHTWIC